MLSQSIAPPTMPAVRYWAIIIGGLQLYAAIQLWKFIDNDWWLILSGLLSVVFGVVLIAFPSTGALALIWVIAWFALIFGCMFVDLAFELKHVADRRIRRE